MRTQSIFLSVVLLVSAAHSFGAAGLRQLTCVGGNTRIGWPTARHVATTNSTARLSGMQKRSLFCNGGNRDKFQEIQIRKSGKPAQSVTADELLNNPAVKSVLSDVLSPKKMDNDVRTESKKMLAKLNRSRNMRCAMRIVAWGCFVVPFWIGMGPDKGLMMGLSTIPTLLLASWWSEYEDSPQRSLRLRYHNAGECLSDSEMTCYDSYAQLISKDRVYSSRHAAQRFAYIAYISTQKIMDMPSLSLRKRKLLYEQYIQDVSLMRAAGRRAPVSPVKQDEVRAVCNVGECTYPNQEGLDLLKMYLQQKHFECNEALKEEISMRGYKYLL